MKDMMGWTHGTYGMKQETRSIFCSGCLGRPIHIWEDNIKVTPSELYGKNGEKCVFESSHIV